MKVKSRKYLEAYAESIWSKAEEELKPCEFVFVLSRLTEKMSLAMLKREEVD